MKICKCGNVIKNPKAKECRTCYNTHYNRGIKYSEIARSNMGKAKLAEKNPMWRGEKVGYHQLHKWIKARIPKPELCKCCKKVPPFDLTNKGIYNRELKNWEWLCRRCHMIKDGRMKNFLLCQLLKCQ